MYIPPLCRHRVMCAPGAYAFHSFVVAGRLVATVAAAATHPGDGRVFESGLGASAAVPTHDIANWLLRARELVSAPELGC